MSHRNRPRKFPHPAVGWPVLIVAVDLAIAQATHPRLRVRRVGHLHRQANVEHDLVFATVEDPDRG